MHKNWNSHFLWVHLCLYSSLAVILTSQEKDIVIKEQYATRLEGSCVTINCTYDFKEEMQLLWFKDSEWNSEKMEFNGFIVYSNTDERAQSSEYSDRVEFFQRNKSNSCTLRMNDLKKNDNGMYNFRFIKEEYKFMSEPFALTVTDNPCKVHLKPPKLNKSFKEGDTVILHCATSAVCELHPEWHVPGSGKISKLMSDITEAKEEGVEKHSELMLNMSWTDDGRTLACRPDGSKDDCLVRSITLTVEYAPKETKIMESLSNKEVKEGEHVTMYCSSKANPNANFMWFKHSQNTFSQPEKELTLFNIKPENSGKYYCQATNKHGKENSHNITINVIYAPKGVKVDAESIIIKEGGRLILTCVVQNSNPAVPEKSYRWYKDGQVISEQIMNTFIVPSIMRSHKGQYHCQAKNSVGETNSSPTEVSVKYAPQNTCIQGPPEIKLGSALNLNCYTEANPSPNHHSWYFKPEHTQRYVTLSHTASVYRIEKVAIDNTGWYKCSPGNVIGKGANSTEFKVLVLYPPRKLHLAMKQVVRESELLNITCTVESSPLAMITLSRTSLTNPEKDPIVVNTVQSNTLTFSAKVSVSHVGVYTCTANNTEGQNYTKQQLKVLYAPKNVQASAHPGEELNEGYNLTLTCKADSVPPVSKYTWEKSSGTHSGTVGQGQTLKHYFLKDSDSGHYFCIASNELGSSNSSPIYIRVKYRPQITIIHNMTLVTPWSVPVHLSCSVHCDPPATSYAWYRLEENTTALSTDQNYTVQPHNPGTYYCYASNDVGKSTSEPVKLFLNRFIIQWLVQASISILVICILIGVIFLLYRIFLRKRSSGKNGANRQSFFFSTMPLWSLSNMHSLGLRNNTRENLVMEEATELSGFRDVHSATAAHSNPPADRDNQAGRPISNIHTVYDAIKLPRTMPEQHHHTEEDLTMTSVNYASLQFMDGNDLNKSVPSLHGCGPVYAEVPKNKQKAKEPQSSYEDYENIPGVYAPKLPFTNINWDSDSSEAEEEEEEEINYSTVSFTVTSHQNPQKHKLSSYEEDKTEYSQIKV